MPMTPEQASAFQETFGRIVANVEQVLLGKTFVIRLGLVALFSEGHLLLEDYPGTGRPARGSWACGVLPGTDVQ